MSVVDQIGVNVALKNVVYSEKLSDDSNCFTASIYIDGKKVGDASDNGSGGEMRIEPRSVRDQLNEIGAKVGLRKVDWSVDPVTIEAECIIGRLLYEWQLNKDFKKIRNGKKIRFVENGEFFALKATPVNDAHRKTLINALLKKNPNAKIFSELPEAEGYKLYCETMGYEMEWELVK